MERRYLSSGTIADIDVHTSVTGIVGANVHWGIPKEKYEHRIEIAESYQIPEKDVQDTGFDRIYQQAPELERSAAIIDEVEAVLMAANEVIEQRGWQRDKIAVVLGSGVPIVDDRRIPNYAKHVAKGLALSKDVITRNIYAACNSGNRGLFVAHEMPELRGRPTLVIGAEGVTALSHDPRRADRFSHQVFSNAVAVTGLIPGVETEVFHHRHKLIIDTNAVLAARMTYKRFTEEITDPTDENQYWQTRGDTEMMIMPEPPEGMDIFMKARATGLFFARNVIPFIVEEYNRYMADHPGDEIAYIYAHHPSVPVHTIVGNGIREKGVPVEMPNVVYDGNSSAATPIIAFNRTLGRSRPGTKAAGVGYGAGGSEDFGIVEFLDPGLQHAA